MGKFPSTLMPVTAVLLGRDSVPRLSSVPQTGNCGLPQVAALVQPLNRNFITEVLSPVPAMAVLISGAEITEN